MAMAPSTSSMTVNTGGNGVGGGSSVGSVDPRSLSYENTNANLDEIYLRQLNEDIAAYKYDLEYCKNQLAQLDLTPQEARTLQLRSLDLGHQIRHCQHRIEIQRFQMQRGAQVAQAAAAAAVSAASAANGNAATGGNASHYPPRMGHTTPNGANQSYKRPGAEGGGGGGGGATNSIQPPSVKRVKLSPSSPTPDMDEDDSDVSVSALFDTGNQKLQRLGLWKCRLCTSEKYLLAGTGRIPAAPCKWPLKDVAKMITHFTEMHTEHSPAERCAELGAALDMNRGPFEYWLRKTRSQNIGDGTMIDECIDNLQSGRLPGLLRRLSRAAAGFPAK